MEMIGKGKRTETPLKKRRRLVTNCEIITTKDYLPKKEAEERIKKRKQKERTKNGIAKRHVTKKLFKWKKKDNELMSDSSEDLDLIDIIEENGREKEKEFALIWWGKNLVQNLPVKKF